MVEVAAAQHGVVTLGQLEAIGFSSGAISRLVAQGLLHRRHAAVYAVGRPDLPPAGRRMAAVSACGAGALLSHAAAAAHRGYRDSAAAVIDVTVPHRRGRGHRGIRLHRRTTLVAEDSDIVHGIPCVSPARALLDIASLRFVDIRGLERAIERAVMRHEYDQRAVERLLERMWGQPGTRKLTIAAGIVRPGKTVSRSDLEELLLALCRAWSLPEPELNASIWLGGEWQEVDFLWRRERVVVEVDGYGSHGTRAAFKRDRHRDRLLELEGWGHARFADQDFDHDRPHIRTVLRRLLGVEPGDGRIPSRG